jgi:hypothetical protein
MEEDKEILRLVTIFTRRVISIGSIDFMFVLFGMLAQLAVAHLGY